MSWWAAWSRLSSFEPALVSLSQPSFVSAFIAVNCTDIRFPEYGKLGRIREPLPAFRTPPRPACLSVEGAFCSSAACWSRAPDLFVSLWPGIYQTAKLSDEGAWQGRQQKHGECDDGYTKNSERRPTERCLSICKVLTHFVRSKSNTADARRVSR